MTPRQGAAKSAYNKALNGVAEAIKRQNAAEWEVWDAWLERCGMEDEKIVTLRYTKQRANWDTLPIHFHGAFRKQPGTEPSYRFYPLKKDGTVGLREKHLGAQFWNGEVRMRDYEVLPYDPFIEEKQEVQNDDPV